NVPDGINAEGDEDHDESGVTLRAHVRSKKPVPLAGPYPTGELTQPYTCLQSLALDARDYLAVANGIHDDLQKEPGEEAATSTA
ncbi:MAG: hypothetical protein Q9218_006358, partial [Villophora microphyllina]